MKTIVILILFNLLFIHVIAQAPQAFRYQAVARNASGAALANQSVSFKISILTGSPTGNVLYVETHTGKTTNSFGLVELEIGKGSVVSGSFQNIGWGSNSCYVKVEMDPNGGTAYQAMGTSQLLSVPYALHSRNVELETDGDAANEIQTLSLNGSQLTLSKGGGTVQLPSPGTGGDNWGTQTVATDATLSGSGLVTNTLRLAQQSATAGQVLKWNGSTWVPGNDLSGGLTIPFSDTRVTNGASFEIINSGTATQQDGIAIRGKTEHYAGFGIWGESSSTTGGGVGVLGLTANPSGFSGYFNGGKFYVSGNTGIGTTNPGAKLEVNGQVKITGGNPGTGKVLTSDATGLASWQTPAGGFTLPFGGTASVDGAALMVTNTNTSGSLSIGMYGRSLKSDGYGIVGEATSATGSPVGVYGINNSPTGFSGYFSGGRFYVSGNVGIGKADPVYKLDVNGDRIRLINGSEWLAMRTDGSTGLLDLSYSGGKLAIGGSSTGEDLLLNPGTNAWVGVRTWNPQYELDVTGNIRATGSVYYGGSAGAANGTAYSKPDYVFGDGYERLKTEQVEEFLHRENHLPWVTSAIREQEENGGATDMTRMAFETLEAVENLQLQLIVQDKLIRELKEENNLLKERLDKLEKLAGASGRK